MRPATSLNRDAAINSFTAGPSSESLFLRSIALSGQSPELIQCIAIEAPGNRHSLILLKSNDGIGRRGTELPIDAASVKASPQQFPLDRKQYIFLDLGRC